MCICHPFIDCFLYEINSQYYMLAFHKEMSFLRKEEMPRNISKKCVSMSVNSQQFFSDVYMYNISGMIFHIHPLHLEK